MQQIAVKAVIEQRDLERTRIGLGKPIFYFRKAEGEVRAMIELVLGRAHEHSGHRATIRKKTAVRQLHIWPLPAGGLIRKIFHSPFCALSNLLPRRSRLSRGRNRMRKIVDMGRNGSETAKNPDPHINSGKKSRCKALSY